MYDWKKVFVKLPCQRTRPLLLEESLFKLPCQRIRPLLLEESLSQAPLRTNKTIVVGKEPLSSSLANTENHCYWKGAFVKLHCQRVRSFLLEESHCQAPLPTHINLEKNPQPTLVRYRWCVTNLSSPFQWLV